MSTASAMTTSAMSTASAVTTSAMSTTSAMTTTSVVSMFAQVGVPEMSIITVICLIALLSCSEVLSASKLWNKRLSMMLNLAILPMVLTFFSIVLFKVMDVVYH
jgi:hypothetical protein